MNIKTLLETEIESELEVLKESEVGSDCYRTIVDGVVKLADKVIELERIEHEKREKAIDRENENSYRTKQMDDDRKDRMIKNCLTATSIVTGVGLTVWGTLKSLKFEETGTVTTIVGRGFINKLLPKK